MQEVTCPQCENIVHITPDSPLCSICGTDLDELVSPEFAAVYFYQRASDMATAGRKQQALSEVNRGLTYTDVSDLRLLGAILASQLGDYGQMRNQVAAIPVDDALREEGEWLLRSHQAKRRAQRTSTKSGQPASESVLPFPVNGEESAPTGGKSKQRNPWPVLFAIAIITILALVWFRGGPGTRSDDPVDGAESVAAETNSAATQAQQDGAVDPPADASSTENEPPIDESGEVVVVINEVPLEEAPNEEAPGEALLPTPTPFPTEPPTPTVEPTPEEISTDGPVDVIAFLAEKGYTGLTYLPIEGELVDGVLLLTGEIPMMEELDVVVSALSSMPEAESIDTAAIALVPPETYTVQVGDNLWTISVRVYGDTEHMNDIFRENRDILPSPEVLTVGAEIKLPPYNP